MKGERITKDMLSADTQLGGAVQTMLSGATAEDPDSPYANNGNPTIGEVAQYDRDFAAYGSARAAWSAHTQPDYTQPGTGTFDFSDDGHDRMPGCTAGIPTRDDGDND